MSNRTELRNKKRRENLELVRKARFKTNAALAETLGEGFSPSYISQLLKGHRGIGDDVADKIEERLGLPFGYLDSDPQALVTDFNRKLWDQVVWLWQHGDGEIMTMFRIMINAMYNKKQQEMGEQKLHETSDKQQADSTSHGPNAVGGTDA